jgi:hypothetical protein
VEQFFRFQIFTIFCVFRVDVYQFQRQFFLRGKRIDFGRDPLCRVLDWTSSLKAEAKLGPTSPSTGSGFHMSKIGFPMARQPQDLTNAFAIFAIFCVFGVDVYQFQTPQSRGKQNTEGRKKRQESRYSGPPSNLYEIFPPLILLSSPNNPCLELSLLPVFSASQAVCQGTFA